MIECALHYYSSFDCQVLCIFVYFFPVAFFFVKCAYFFQPSEFILDLFIFNSDFVSLGELSFDQFSLFQSPSLVSDGGSSGLSGVAQHFHHNLVSYFDICDNVIVNVSDAPVAGLLAVDIAPLNLGPCDLLSRTLAPVSAEMSLVIVTSLALPVDHVCSVIRGIDVRVRDLKRLLGVNWLNDTVVDAYFSLLALRSEQPGFKSAYCFPSQFHARLLSGGYTAVSRWVRHVPLQDFAHIFIPLHIKDHWTLIFVDTGLCKILYLDSLLPSIVD